MLLCQAKGCTCFHHQLLGSMKRGFNYKVLRYLQDIDTISDVADASKKTLMHYSVEYGNNSILEYLIRKGCEVNAQNDAGVTPIMMAVMTKNVTAVGILLDSHADIYVTDSKGVNTLQLAFQCRIYATIKLVRPHCQLILDMIFEKVNEDFLGDKAAITKLLLNANVMVKMAVVTVSNIELATTILTDYPIDFCEPVVSWSALHCTIVLGKFENAKLLIAHKANLDIRDDNGYMPLGYYTRNMEDVDENSEILKSFLKFSKSVTQPVERYCQTSHVNTLLVMGTKKTVMTLCQSNVDAIKSYISNCSPLCLLGSNRNIDLVDIIQSADSAGVTLDVNACDCNGTSALMMVVQWGFDAIRTVECLIKFGANVNHARPDEVTVLQAAAANCESKADEKLIELLLWHGANAQLVFNDGKTLIDYFCTCKYIRQIYSLEPMVAHLAMLEAINTNSVIQVVRNSIDAYSKCKIHFDLCMKQLQELKDTTVYGTVTLFKLLHENDEKLLGYARNHELIVAFQTIMKQMNHLEQYYVNTLQKQLTKAVDRVALEEKAIPAIEILIGLSNDVYHTVVHQIIAYLDFKDLQNLLTILNAI